jgi:hypothetical protein
LRIKEQEKCVTLNDHDDDDEQAVLIKKKRKTVVTSYKREQQGEIINDYSLWNMPHKRNCGTIQVRQTRYKVTALTEKLVWQVSI